MPDAASVPTSTCICWSLRNQENVLLFAYSSRPTAGEYSKISLSSGFSSLHIYSMFSQHFLFLLNFCSFHLFHCLRCHHPVCDQDRVLSNPISFTYSSRQKRHLMNQITSCSCSLSEAGKVSLVSCAAS